MSFLLTVLDQLRQAVTRMMISWYDVKMFVEHASLVSSDALHVIVGVLVWVLIAFILLKPLSNFISLLILLLATLFNEFVDLWVERWPDQAMQYGESAKDLLLTMMLPTLILALVRARPQLFDRSSGRSRRRSGAKSR